MRAVEFNKKGLFRKSGSRKDCRTNFLRSLRISFAEFA